MADEFNARDHILGLRHELRKIEPSRDTALAWEQMDRLQQTLWRLGIDVQGASGVWITPDIMRERAMAALLEIGNNRRGADVIITHLVNRGVIDLTTWRKE
jgi:hypothetical protein